MSLKYKFNKLIETKGIDAFKNKWNPAEESTYDAIVKSLKTYHPHSWIYEPIQHNHGKVVVEQNKMPDVYVSKDSIGHIVFYSFNTGYGKSKTDTDVKQTESIVREFLDTYGHFLKGLIIDFCNHGGGWYLPCILGLKRFFNNSSLIYFGKQKGTKSLADKGWVNCINNKIRYNQPFVKQQEPFAIPIAVIVNSKTNSSGEIAAAIFKGRKNCQLIGSPTYGNLSSNETFSVNQYRVVLTTEVLTTYDMSSSERLFPDIETSKPISEAKRFIRSVSI